MAKSTAARIAPFATSLAQNFIEGYFRNKGRGTEDPYEQNPYALTEGIQNLFGQDDLVGTDGAEPEQDPFSVIKGLGDAFRPEDPIGGDSYDTTRSTSRSFGTGVTPPPAPSIPTAPPVIPIGKRPDAPVFVRDAFNKYREAVADQPQREDYNPTKMRILLSGLASAGVGYGSKSAVNAYNVMNDLMTSPYKNAVADWTAKTSHLKGLADAEGSNNRELWDRYYQSEGLAATNANRAALDENADLARQLRERTENRQQGMADLRKQALSNSGRILVRKDGMAVVFPAVGPPRVYPKEVFEGLTFEERQKMIQDDRMEIIEDDQKFDERMEAMRQRNRIAEKQTPSAGSITSQTDPGFSPGETNQEMRNRMNLWRQYHPEHVDWIDDKSGVMTLPGRSLFGGPSAQEQETARNNYLEFLRTGVDPTGAAQGSTTPQKPDRVTRPGVTPPGPRVTPPGARRAPRQTRGPQAPPLNERQVEDTHTFPGGRTVTWDGQGWK